MAPASPLHHAQAKTRLFSALAVATLALSACGGNLSSTKSLPQNQVSSTAAATPSTATPATTTPAVTTAAAETTSAAPSPTVEPTSEAPTVEPTTEAPAPEPTTVAPTTAAPTTAAPTQAVVVSGGTNCGPSTTGASTLVLAEGSASCAEVKSVFAEFNDNFGGSDAPVTIQGYICHSRNEDVKQREGRTVSCTKGNTRLEAMTHYPLGGIPVAEGNYLAQGDGIYFQSNGMGCGIYATGVDCQHGSKDPVKDGGTFKFLGWDADSAPMSEGGGGNPGPNPYFEGPELPAGYAITAFGNTCMNDGTYLTCTNEAGKAFKANTEDFQVL